MTVASEFEEANKSYVSTFSKGHLPMPPGRKTAVIVCMDARLDPARFLGLEEGDVHVIRNAGGRAFDAIRSVIISQQLLGTREIVVIHHTDCGMLTFTDDSIRAQLHDQDLNADHIAFLPFSDIAKSVRDDIKILKESPFVLDVPITGYIYDVQTGKIEKVN